MFRKIAFAVFLTFVVLSLVFAFKSDRDVTTDSVEAYAEYQEGMQLMEKLYYRQAAERFEKAVELDSNFVMAYSNLARSYAGLGFSDKAKEAQEKAYSLKENVSERERLYIELVHATEEGDTASTRKMARAYIENYPNYREGYLYLGGMEAEEGNYEVAIELMLKAAKIDPEFANAQNLLGYYNFYLGRYDEALVHLENYSQLAPDEANPHDSRGEILDGLGRYEDAIAEFREAYNINPDFDFALEHMAFSYLALGKISQVEYCFQTLMERAVSDEKRNQYYRSWGIALANERQYDSAKQMFRRILENDSTNTSALYYLGYVNFLQRDLSHAEAAFDSVKAIVAARVEKEPYIKENRQYESSNKYMAAMLADLRGDLEEASADFSDVVDMTIMPTAKLRIRYYYADCLRRQGETDLAKSELQRNLSTNPNHTRSLLLLADIYEAEGEQQSARSYRDRVLEIWSDADPDFKPLVELKEQMRSEVALVDR